MFFFVSFNHPPSPTSLLNQRYFTISFFSPKMNDFCNLFNSFQTTLIDWFHSCLPCFYFSNFCSQARIEHTSSTEMFRRLDLRFNGQTHTSSRFSTQAATRSTWRPSSASRCFWCAVSNRSPTNRSVLFFFFFCLFQNLLLITTITLFSFQEARTFCFLDHFSLFNIIRLNLP